MCCAESVCTGCGSFNTPGRVFFGKMEGNFQQTAGTSKEAALGSRYSSSGLFADRERRKDEARRAAPARLPGPLRK